DDFSVLSHRSERGVTAVADEHDGMPRCARAEDDVTLGVDPNRAVEGVCKMPRRIPAVSDLGSVKPDVWSYETVASLQSHASADHIDEDVAVETGGIGGRVVAVTTVANGSKAIDGRGTRSGKVAARSPDDDPVVGEPGHGA